MAGAKGFADGNLGPGVDVTGNMAAEQSSKGATMKLEPITADQLIAHMGMTVHTYAGPRGEVQRQERLRRIYAESGTVPIEQATGAGPSAVYVRNDWDRAALTVADRLQA